MQLNDNVLEQIKGRTHFNKMRRENKVSGLPVVCVTVQKRAERRERKGDVTEADTHTVQTTI